MIWLRLNLDGGILSPLGLEVFKKSLKKVKETDKNRQDRLGLSFQAQIDGKTENSKRQSGIDIYKGSPWYFAMKMMLEVRRASVEIAISLFEF